MTGASLRAAIAAACDLTNPRLSEVDWDEVASAFVRIRDEATLDAARTPALDVERLVNALLLVHSWDNYTAVAEARDIAREYAALATPPEEKV